MDETLSGNNTRLDSVTSDASILRLGGRREDALSQTSMDNGWYFEALKCDI